MRAGVRGVAIVCCAVFGIAPAASADSDSPLIDAVKSRNPEAVRGLIKGRADVNAPQGDGATPLHWAVHYDEPTIADALIRAGARVNAADDVGVTPLFVACTNRNSSLVQKLLASGADPNAALLSGETVLMNCARTGNAASVAALIAAGAKVEARESAHEQTALMWAAAEAHPDAVQVLLDAGADVGARSRTYAQTVTGEQTQRAGREELNYTTLRGGSTPLLFAARVGDARSTTALLKAGANPNDRFPNGMTALIEASYSGHPGVAGVLLEHGADPNDAAIGFTALHAAVLRSDLDLVKTLLAHGASPNPVMTKGTPIRRNTTDYNLPATLIGATPYLLAAKFLEPEIMRLLAARDADTTLTLPDGTTAIMLAAGVGAIADGNRRGVAVLDGGRMEAPGAVTTSVVAALELGADVNRVNASGDTALHAAAGQGDDGVVQLLVSKGADLNVKNKRGLTPLALAKGEGRRRPAPTAAGGSPPSLHPSTVQLLLTLGASD